MKKNYLFQLVICLLFSSGIFAQAPVSQTFGASGTFVVNAGYSCIVTIEAWGGGGGGGNLGGANAGGGGGGGAYAKSTAISLGSGSYTVTVGAGGAAGAAGGNSSFTTLVIAAGGASNTLELGGPGGTTAASTGTTLWKGGDGGGGTTNGGSRGGGGGGGSATSTAAGGAGGTANIGLGGIGGTGFAAGGKGGDDPLGTDAAAGAGIGAGGGGKSKAGASTSKAGIAGQVIVTVNTVLAVKISYLNGVRSNGANTLNWLAACKSDNAVFEIERSTDGRNFATINTVIATQLQCAQPLKYVDNTILSGTVFYRIKAVDIYGSIVYSAIIKLGGQEKELQLIGVLPNPVVNTAQLSIVTAKKDKVELSVLTMEGKVVQRSSVQLQPGSSIIDLNVANLQKGVYMIKGIFGEGETNTIKFVKQ